MRVVVLDTETTGFCRGCEDVSVGHRIVEIACVELLDGRLSGGRFHRYFNPERNVDPKAVKVHGLTDSFLSDKPLFSDEVKAFIGFMEGVDVVVIHNASFDIAFIDKEFSLCGVEFKPVRVFRYIDTLKVARALFPGQRNRLEDLCNRFSIKGRGLYHGALVDAEMLAQVYLILLKF